MNLKQQFAALLLMVMVFAVNASGAVLITNFGTSSDFVVIEENSYYTSLSTAATDITVEFSTGGETVVGSIATASMVGNPFLSLTGILNGVNPNATFTVTLFNSDSSQYQQYSGSTDSFSEVASSAELHLEFQTESFNAGDISYFQFSYDGSDTPLSFTFQSLTADAASTPEPATWALVVASLAVASTCYRRKCLG